jgi:quercetin dioxygenase-like cupin family protein
MASNDTKKDSGVKTDVLVKSDKAWNGTPYEPYAAGPPELTVMRMTISPHTTLPWHTHPMPNAAYILSGHLTVEDRVTGEKKVTRAGEAFAEQVGTEHRGYTEDEACVAIVTYAGTRGVPTSVPAPGEEPEY